MNETVSGSLTDISDKACEKRSIASAAIIQAIFTLLSRVFGMIRDVMVTHIFGAGAITDAFLMAFTIPNVFRQFLGEGAFSVAFVPIFVATRELTGEQKARQFFQHAFGFLCCLLFMVTLAGVVFSESLVQLFAYGFKDNVSQFALTNTMTKLLFPYIFMISLVALFGAYLACYQRFAAMAAAPVFLNITMIIGMLLFIDRSSPSVMVLVVSVLLGGLLQLVLMAWALARAGLWAWPAFSLSSEPMKRLVKLLGPALFGIFVYQLNIVILRQLASFLGEGQITYYYNADRLAQFATGVFAVSISTAALPQLSKNLAGKAGQESFFATLRFTLALTSFLITPCAFGLIVFAKPVISVLFVHGAFTYQDALSTSYTLMAFAPSIIAFGLSRPLIQAFYAHGDTKTPVMVGIVTVLSNLALGLALLRFSVVGLSLTLSISSTMQYFILLLLFSKRNQYRFKTQLLRPFLLHAGISAIACGVGLIFYNWADWSLGLTLKNAVILALLSGSAAGAYFLFAYYFKLNEAMKFIDGLKLRLFS